MKEVKKANMESNDSQLGKYALPNGIHQNKFKGFLNLFLQNPLRDSSM